MARKTVYILSALLLALTLVPAAPSAVAQEAPKAASTAKPAETKPIAVYRLDYVVRELDGDKVLNSRTYNVSEKSGEWNRLRVGSRVPVQMGENQVQYQDVGINIDSRLDQLESESLLSTTFESSSVVETGSGFQTLSGRPIIRQVRFTSTVILTPGRPIMVGKLDDVATNRHYEVEVTATKVR